MAETTRSSRPRYLPPDIISRILSFLPIEDILRCGTVCKAWYKLTKASYFINLQLRATNFLSESDRIILAPNSMNIYLLDTERKNVREISLRKIFLGWERHSFSIMGSCLGFLCFASDIYPNPVIVCNPITKERVVLPLYPVIFPVLHVGLGYDPSSDKYKVVKVLMDKDSGHSKFLILTLGDHSWRPLGLSYRVLFRPSVFPRYYDGALYWVIDKAFHNVGNGFILVLNLTTEKFCVIEFPENVRFPTYIPGAKGFGNLYLINVGGSLIIIEDAGRLMHFWSVLRRRDGGFALGHFVTELNARWNVFSRPVLIAVKDRCLLLEVTKFGMEEERDLVWFSPERKQYISSQIRGLPSWFTSHVFQPNLLSPLAASVVMKNPGDLPPVSG